jgi:hypothetical protein
VRRGIGSNQLELCGKAFIASHHQPFLYPVCPTFFPFGRPVSSTLLNPSPIHLDQPHNLQAIMALPLGSGAPAAPSEEILNEKVSGN